MMSMIPTRYCSDPPMLLQLLFLRFLMRLPHRFWCCADQCKLAYAAEFENSLLLLASFSRNAVDTHLGDPPALDWTGRVVNKQERDAFELLDEIWATNLRTCSIDHRTRVITSFKNKTHFISRFESILSFPRLTS